MQLSMMFFLPSILLSGFMFPFAGMPVWAQYLGEGLPLTHYIRIVRAIMLKGAVISNLQVSVESQTAARSRIMDADFAAETANLSRAQILQQAGNAMIAQANQLPQQVLTLLR